MDQDSNNYLAYMQYGKAKLNMPALFGGSEKEALEYFLKAKSALEKTPEDCTGNWNYLYLITLIGKLYTSLEDYDSARNIYINILRLEPGFKYVRDDLYPQLLKY